MTLQFAGLSTEFSLGLPLRSGGLILFALGGIGLFYLWLSSARDSSRRPAAAGWGLPILFLAGVGASLFLIVTIPAPGALATPGLPLQARGASFPLLGSIPWMLAAGWLGAPMASLVAAIGGLARAGWITHSLLTPVSAGLQAALAAWLLRRDYPDAIGRAARQPLLAVLASGLVFGAMRCLELYLYSGGGLYDGLEYVAGLARPTMQAALIEAAIAGLAAEVVRTLAPARWPRPVRLAAGPHQRSLGARMVSVFVGVGLVAAAILLAGNWLLAEDSARDLVARQMSQLSRQAAAGVPYFVQTGRTFLSQAADELRAGSVTPEALEQVASRLAFFQRLAVVDSAGQVSAVWPRSRSDLGLDLAAEAAVATALDGVAQEVTVVHRGDPPTVEVIFLAPVRGESDSPAAVLLGWTDVATNPLLQPVRALLMDSPEGEALIADETGTVVLHSDERQVGRRVTVGAAATGELFEQTAPDGTRRLIQVLNVPGYPWRVQVSFPQSAVNRLTLQIAARLFAVTAAVGVLVVLLVYASSRRLTRPLRAMAQTAESIARGNLDRSVQGLGEDEIGRLAASFERMRRSLKSRLEEMDLLLSSSQRLASSYELDRALPPILEGVQNLTHSDLVRMVLVAESSGRPTGAAFSAGGDPGGWASLDAAILDLCRQRGRFVLENPARARALLDLGGLTAPLEGLLALPLRSEDVFVGCLWVGYRRPHVFSQDETSLLSILAGQLGVSVANARLFMRAKVEQLRLSAILEATPDGVILLDSRGMVLLANPAAEVVLTTTAEGASGRMAGDVVGAPALLELLDHSGDSGGTGEIPLPDGRVLFVSVIAGPGQEALGSGTICVLRDITHYKKLDTLKSEFVSTVSHDLRTPLTLMRGYGTMLSMVGSLNDQQKDFSRKILDSVEHMGRLVDNLLDLGRIEAGVGLNLERIDPGGLVRDVVGTYLPQAANKNVTVDVDVQDGMTAIDVDSTLLRQAVANLVDNAIKYTPAKGRVAVRARQSRGMQQFIVEDTGLGVAPADLPRLFEKFYRARGAEARREKGSGLGLAIVKSIAEQHGGRVSVESRLGAGSTFTLEIPVVGTKAAATLDKGAS
ncbi:MAG TPA: ATP-binding protein [Anaerolineales bacterium]|nr:ATP-binding protein [Anaerolineales bacterium]